MCWSALCTRTGHADSKADAGRRDGRAAGPLCSSDAGRRSGSASGARGEAGDLEARDREARDREAGEDEAAESGSSRQERGRRSAAVRGRVSR